MLFFYHVLIYSFLFSLVVGAAQEGSDSEFMGYRLPGRQLDWQKELEEQSKQMKAEKPIPAQATTAVCTEVFECPMFWQAKPPDGSGNAYLCQTASLETTSPGRTEPRAKQNPLPTLSCAAKEVVLDNILRCCRRDTHMIDFFQQCRSQNDESGVTIRRRYELSDKTYWNCERKQQFYDTFFQLYRAQMPHGGRTFHDSNDFKIWQALIDFHYHFAGKHGGADTHSDKLGLKESSPSFLPWHRMFMFQFESYLQYYANDCSLTLPYVKKHILHEDNIEQIFGPKYTGFKVVKEDGECSATKGDTLGLFGNAPSEFACFGDHTLRGIEHPIRNGLGMGFLLEITKADHPDFGKKKPVVRGMSAFADIGKAARRAFSMMVHSEFIFDPYPQSDEMLHGRLLYL